MQRSLFLCLALCLTLSLTLSATTILVPDQYPTIQSGIDASVDGDTVLVADGIYIGDGNRDLNLDGRFITLISAHGPAATILDLQGDTLDPHRALVLESNEDTATVIEGFTFTNGWHEQGGAVFIDMLTAARFVNCRFENNYASSGGGAVYGDIGSSGYFHNCEFINNTARFGGAVQWRDYWFRTMWWNCIFEGNTAERGGAMDNSFAYGTYNECIFRNNHSSGSAGVLSSQMTSPTFNDCLFEDNSAVTTGGVFSTFESSPLMHNCVVKNNSAAVGGVYYWHHPGVKHDGQEKWIFEIVNNCTMIGNSATDSAAVLYAKVALPKLQPAGIPADLYDSAYPDKTDFTFGLFNTIITGSTGPELVTIANPESVPGFFCCDLWSNPAGDWTGVIADQSSLNGNLSVDPAFCDAASGDYGIDYYSVCAPANNDCHELVGALPVACLSQLCGDITGDGELDMSDITYMVNYYFLYGPESDPVSLCDSNCDGDVDISDLVYLVTHLYFNGAPPCCPI